VLHHTSSLRRIAWRKKENAVLCSFTFPPRARARRLYINSMSQIENEKATGVLVFPTLGLDPALEATQLGKNPHFDA
jgi:hypothetical protein